MRVNPILTSDSYKYSHAEQYPAGVTHQFSYLESRGGDFSHTVFFGLQYFLKEYMRQRVTMADVDEAEGFIRSHGLPFNRKGWERIVKLHGGKLPVIIRAVPEGSVIPVSNILMSVENTDPECQWLVSFLETSLLKGAWYGTTVATQSYFLKKLIRSYLDRTADNPDGEINFKLHDFGYRGVSSEESAMIGGAAHLVNFMGSDTIAGIRMLRDYYGERMAGYSIPAAEHSTMTMWGKENEARAYENMLEIYKDQPIFACVSDSYDIYNAAENIWGGELRDKVIAYKGTLVIRPDSGDPAEVCGGLLQRLEEKFGATVNSKGFKVINHDVRIIQGDGVNPAIIQDVLRLLTALGYSTTNIAFGMGGALLQSVNRDTCKFAFKCSAAKQNGEWKDVFKMPITDTGKKSKKGLLDLNVTTEGLVHTVRRGGALNSLMTEVYRDGEIVKEYTLSEIRENTRTQREQYRGWQDRPVY